MSVKTHRSPSVSPTLARAIDRGDSSRAVTELFIPFSLLSLLLFFFFLSSALFLSSCLWTSTLLHLSSTSFFRSHSLPALTIPSFSRWKRVQTLKHPRAAHFSVELCVRVPFRAFREIRNASPSMQLRRVFCSKLCELEREEFPSPPASLSSRFGSALTKSHVLPSRCFAPLG